jgi:hypothetical protein
MREVYSEEQPERVSDPFDNPRSPRTYSTELENTDTFDVQDIFELGFLRSNPTKAIYVHKDKDNVHLEELHGVDVSVKDRVVRRVVITLDAKLPLFSKVIYNSTKPKKEEIEAILKTI